MENLPQFLAYANAFEKTLKDDDWTRLEPFFASDAIYQVHGSFGCRLVGTQAIFRGMKKSLDGFDRKFDSRNIEVTDGPSIEGDTVRLGWAVTYHKQGLQPYVLRGRSEVRYRDGKIVSLIDSYEDEAVAQSFVEWQAANGIELDPRYV
ncbi:MAG TPA: nuclear transport factor 2 family protein [Terriglobales bacterium]|nr:nuclear transport factor 2 family protein [Terriglobales bacterium]